MKRWLWLLILGVVFFLLFLISNIPAGLAVSVIESQLQGKPFKPQIYEVSGTLWQGEAGRVDISGQRYTDVRWELHPWSLLLAQMSGTVAFKQNENRVSATVSRSFFGSLTLSDASVRYGAQDLVRLAKLPALQLGGLFDLSLEELTLEDKNVTHATGVLKWQNSASLFPQNVKLGDLQATITTDDNGIKAAIKDGGGPLELSGEFLLTPAGEYKFKAQLASREPPESPLSRAVMATGKMNQQGKMEVNTGGKLADFGFLFK